MGSGGMLGDFSSGLYNSARFVVEMLNREGVRAKLVDVIDGNGVDAEVYKYRPDVVVVEAFWVTPSKFDELMKLHPSVRWVVRNHSKIPFLAQEGIALEWTYEYVRRFIQVACNSRQATRDMRELVSAAGLPAKLVRYLPNYYPPGVAHWDRKPMSRHSIDIGCFGAIRPLKNQLIQAIAAISFAQSEEKTLRFHINSERVEGGGDPILKSLRSAFRNTQHKLVEHSWLSWREFLFLVGSMDINMQVSYSETFNIVAAEIGRAHV